MADVARLAGVSKKTVSNYFNGYPYFKPETKARIEAAIAELNYKVNHAARSLKSGKTGRIGLAVPELAQPYFAELAQTVVSTAQRRGFEVLVEVTGGDLESERRVLSGSRTRDVDGIILCPLALEDADLLAATGDVPLVLIGDRGGAGRFDFVTVNGEGGVYDVTAHLISTGRRRIVGLGWEEPGDATAASQRTRGYRRALEDAGLGFEPALEVGPLQWNVAGGQAAMEQFLVSGVTFDAVVGFNDAIALGAMAALYRAGIHVPSDVAVAGFDNVAEASYCAPPLTTVDAGLPWVAEHALELLAERLEHAPSAREPVTHVAPHALVTRASA